VRQADKVNWRNGGLGKAGQLLIGQADHLLGKSDFSICFAGNMPLIALVQEFPLSSRTSGSPQNITFHYLCAAFVRNPDT